MQVVAASGDGPLPAPPSTPPDPVRTAPASWENTTGTASPRAAWSEVERWATPLENQLVASGVAPTAARHMVRVALARAGDQRLHLLRDHLLGVVAETLVCAAAPWLGNQPQTLALVGPPGVGKTTTLAKMAAAAGNNGRSVALINTDMLRVGAQDVLERYSELLRIPVAAARTPEELEQALTSFVGMDLVLVDTAGRTDAASLLRLGSLLTVESNLQVVLTLAAPSSHLDILDMALRYAPLRPQGLVITKLDEARAPGSILSSGVSAACPLLGLTHGQRIPQDLAPANALSLAQQMVH